MDDNSKDPTAMEVDSNSIKVTPNPDKVLAIRLTKYFSRLAEGQDGILRLSSFMDRRGEGLNDLTSQVREKVELYLDDEIDTEALESLVDHVMQRLHSDHPTEADEEENESSLKELESILNSIPKGHASSYVDGIMRALGSKPSDQLLRSSLLVSLVGELEIYINQVLRAIYERIPSAVDDKEATFTWSEVSSFDTLDAFRESVTERAVEKVLHGSYSDWIDHFEKRFGVKIDGASKDRTVIEIFQRRHCIVHNGGRASQLYVKKMEEYDSSVEFDEPLKVTSEYLETAADALYEAAMILGWAISQKIIKDEDFREYATSEYINNIYQLLVDKRYSLAQSLSERIPENKLPLDQGLIVKVNRWLAYKLDGQFAKVKDEVESFNTNSLSKRFKLARNALLDDHEAAYRIAQSMLEQEDEELPLSHYLTWPLLRGVRQWERANIPNEHLRRKVTVSTDVVASNSDPVRKDVE